MSRIRPWQSKINVSSYLIPIIISIFVLILIIRAFFWWTSDDRKVDNSSFLNISSNEENSELYIYMSWDSSKLLDWDSKMYSTDNKLEVRKWEAKLTTSSDSTKLYANKLAEIRYNWLKQNKEDISLLNWELWIENDKTPLNISTRNFSVSSLWWTVFSLSQNLMADSLYVLKWEIDVTFSSSKVASPVKIWVWQKIEILNVDLTDENFKVEDKIVPIDDFFKEEDFFIKHNWNSFLNSTSLSSSWSTNDSSWSISAKSSKVILITYPEDETTLDTNTINIEWSIVSDNVVKISVNDKIASIDTEAKTFVLKDFLLSDSVNNLVYKAYDKDDNIISKWVLTVYSTSKEKSKDEKQKPTVTTYPLSSKDFRIVEPAENPYKTTENLVKIAWQLNKWSVKFITINDFRLTKFSAYSSSWYYFANKDYWTMNDWINLYTIKYYWKEDELLYTSLFTIVKEAAIKDENTDTITTPTDKEDTTSPTQSWSNTNS